MNNDQLKQDLIRDEGIKLHEYKDHLGYSTIGVGRLIDPAKNGGITYDEAMYLLDNDIKRVCQQLDTNLPWFKSSPEHIQRALCNMAFQMGIKGLLGFKNTLRYLQLGDYEKAAKNARDSLWYKQTPKRAERTVQLFTQ